MKKNIFYLFLLCCCSCIFVPINKSFIRSNKQFGEAITINLTTWQAVIDLTSLSIRGKKNNTNILLTEGLGTHSLKPSNVNSTSSIVSCDYEDLGITIKLFSQNDRLHIRIISKKQGRFSWPVMGCDPSITALIVPDGEGLYLPNKDLFWQKQLKGLVYITQGSDSESDGGLIAPFWGYDFNDGTISFIAHSDLHNRLTFDIKNGRLIQSLSHDFSAQEGFLPFEMSVAITEALSLAPAFNFRRYLIENNNHKTLKEKIAENQEITKLSGALHAYVWGDGRTINALEDLSALGIKHMWIGYEDKPHNLPQGKWIKQQHYVAQNFIDYAKKRGFLIGPYDSFHTMQSSQKADSANDYFGDRYPYACVVLKDGNNKVGYAGRGCHTSSEAFVLEQPKNKTIYDRVNSFAATGVNSYFLDCDATGEFFDDYSSEHPMNMAKDRTNRMERMKYIASDKKLVLGSETAAAWSIPVLAFAHGNFATYNKIHWSFTQDKQRYGSWWPLERPSIFFKKINPSADYIKAKYDPIYRLPLFQAVYHDAIVTTDRWEIAHEKSPSLVSLKELFELLYGVPSIWALDRKAIKDHSAKLKKLSKFFDLLHEAIFLEPLTSFKWLSADKLVQQTNFGDKVQVTANFSSTERHGVPAKAIVAYWMKEKKEIIYLP